MKTAAALTRPAAVLPQLAIWLVVFGFVAMLGGWGARLALGALACGFALLCAVVVARLWRMLSRR